MIFSPETFINIIGLSHLGLIILMILMAAQIVLVTLAKTSAAKAQKRAARKEEQFYRDRTQSLEDAHKHFETHAHEAGETIKKGDLVMVVDGLLMKADKSKFAHPYSPRVVVEMFGGAGGGGKSGTGAEGMSMPVGLVKKPAPRKRPAAKKVAKKVIKKKK